MCELLKCVQDIIDAYGPGGLRNQKLVKKFITQNPCGGEAGRILLFYALQRIPELAEEGKAKSGIAAAIQSELAEKEDISAEIKAKIFAYREALEKALELLTDSLYEAPQPDRKTPVSPPLEIEPPLLVKTVKLAKPAAVPPPQPSAQPDGQSASASAGQPANLSVNPEPAGHSAAQPEPLVNSGKLPVPPVHAPCGGSAGAAPVISQPGESVSESGEERESDSKAVSAESSGVNLPQRPSAPAEVHSDRNQPKRLNIKLLAFLLAGVCAVIGLAFALCENGNDTAAVTADRAPDFSSELQEADTVASAAPSASETPPADPADKVLAAANKGDAEAQYKMGNRCYFGSGAIMNLEEAVKWYRLAAAQDHPAASYKMGLCFYKGLGGLNKDYAQAVSYWSKAKNCGNHDAARALDNLENDADYQYFLGQKREESGNLGEALVYYEKAARQGHAKAQAAAADLKRR